MTHLPAGVAAAVAATALAAVPASAASGTAPTVVTPREAIAATAVSARHRAQGRLLVTVAAPAGVTADIVVHGPGDYRARVSDTVKLRGLRKGRYHVVARRVVEDERTAAGRIDDATVRVHPGRTKDVTVTYRWLPDDDLPPPQPGPTAFQAEVVRLTNKARSRSQNCGKEGTMPAAPALSVNGKLTAAARGHARDMAAHSYFDHTSRTGRDPGQRISAAGYRWSWWGENIAAGFDTPQQVVAGWLDSDGHCANLMSRHFTQIGVGYAKDADSAYRTYWVQDFARPR